MLIEALACGCDVVSTRCPSGPSEILDNGRYGALVPVGDIGALAQAILSTIENTPTVGVPASHLAQFSAEESAREYLRVLMGTE